MLLTSVEFVNDSLEQFRSTYGIFVISLLKRVKDSSGVHYSLISDNSAMKQAHLLTGASAERRRRFGLDVQCWCCCSKRRGGPRG